MHWTFDVQPVNKHSFEDQVIIAQWKMLVVVNIKKLDNNSILALKQQLLGVILYFFMHTAESDPNF